MQFEPEVEIPVDSVSLPGKLMVPESSPGLVVFAHGSGSSRFSPRNNFVAEYLNDRGLGTLLFDLLTGEEDRVRENRFDIDLLTDRLSKAARWARDEAGLPLGLFGSSTGAAAALRAAAELRDGVDAVVSRGGRMDLAGEALPEVEAPTLMVVGGQDRQVLELNRDAADRMRCESEVAVVEGAGHLFEGPGQLEEVAELAADWFVRHLEG